MRATALLLAVVVAGSACAHGADDNTVRVTLEHYDHAAVPTLETMAVKSKEEVGECDMYWYTRLTFESTPGVWTTGLVGNLKTTRAAAEEYNQAMIRDGHRTGPILEDWSDLGHIAPSAIKAAPVRRVCCRQVGPPSEWWCIYPDGE